MKANLLDGIGLGMAEAVGGGTKSNKIISNQVREEVTIRNSDSGKGANNAERINARLPFPHPTLVMGVKGRRVALIEEISKTVISFQKVDPKCKERQLTIIADQKEAIECAKRLIAETIERNVSPERVGAGGECLL